MFSAFSLAFRRLATTPGFTLTALITLAICVGANLTIFSVVDSIMLRSLPFPGPNRLVLISNSYPKAGDNESRASIANYFERRQSLKSFASLSLYDSRGITIGGESAPTRINILKITPDFFQTLGVTLAKGHIFTDAQLTFGNDDVAILTDGFWRSYFNADPHVIGRTFLNDGEPVTVIGVLPAGFHFLSENPEFFRPASHDLEERTPKARHSNNYIMIGRLAAGVTITEAQAEIDLFNAKQLPSDPYRTMVSDAGFHTLVRSLHGEHIRAIKPVLLLLQYGVLFLLLIGCVNLVNLLLIRVTNRAKEYAMRQALGARDIHIAREILAETSLLGAGGGIYGLGLGVFGIDWLHHLGTDLLPLGAQIHLSGPVVTAAVVLSIVVSTALALPMIIYVLRVSLAAGLRIESRGSTSSRGVRRLRHAFVVAQIALAFILLSGAALLGLSLHRVLATQPGFDTQNVMAGGLALPWKNYKTPEARLAFTDRLIAGIKAIPGVRDAAINSNLPFASNTNDSAITVLDRKPEPGESLHVHFCYIVSGEYWKTMGIRLLQGRPFTETDGLSQTGLCIVDEAFAKNYWPNGDAIGHRISSINEHRPLTIIGIVNNVLQNELTETKAHGAVYFNYAPETPSSFHVVVRTTLAPSSASLAVRNVLTSIDPEMAMKDFKLMGKRVDDTLVARRSPAILAGIFGFTALLLAALGTYGILSYSVAQHQIEIGVRLALGAQPAQIGRHFLNLGVRLLSIGAAIGLLGSWAAGQIMQSALYECSGFDVRICLATLVVMTFVSLTACVIPAARATKVDPAECMRA